MIQAVSLKPALIVGIVVFIVFVSLGLYLSLTPDLKAREKVKRAVITIGIGAIFALIVGGGVHSLMFDLANPELAATNFAISQTVGAVLGR